MLVSMVGSFQVGLSEMKYSMITDPSRSPTTLICEVSRPNEAARELISLVGPVVEMN